MQNPRVFISFDYDYDLNAKNLFVGQIRNSRTPFNIQDWSPKAELPQSSWQTTINDKINRCNILIVLIGQNIVSAKGVHKEILMARNNDVPVFGIYVNNAKPIHALYADMLNKFNIIDWEWQRIAQEIDKAMKIGKNKGL